MSSAKAALKAAKSALDRNAFGEAENQARVVLEDDISNYFALLFLGRSLEKQSRLEDAADAYDKGTRSKPNDELAWKGLCGVYEAQGSKRVANYTAASLQLAEIYKQSEHVEKCQTVVDKLVSHAKENGTREQYKDALKSYLPTSSIYDFLEGRIPHPAFTYSRLAAITEADEKERINREVGQRRTRLGAKLAQVQLDVKREVYRDSDLEDLYRQCIDWVNDDEERRKFEEKLLEHAYDHMKVLLIDDKVIKRRQVQELAHGMVIIKHPFRLAWDIELEWHDVDDVASLDRNVLLEYIQFFPEAGLSRVIQAFLGQRHTPNSANSDESEEQRSDFQALDAESALLLVDDGISDSPKSAFAHRLVADFYLRIAEYESCAAVCRKGLQLLKTDSETCALAFVNSKDAVSSCLGTSLVYYQAPKNHPEAKSIFNDLLKRRPHSTSALLGIGLIYEEQEHFEQASEFLERALGRDPGNVRIAAEAAWCKALNGNLETGLNSLSECLTNLESQKHSPRELRALVSYRVGQCQWNLHTDRTSRKARNGPYAQFIASIRANPAYAPAYTSLGIYYLDYARDRKRARQCFQKAFELSAAEIVAAEQLAREFAKDANWDIVEVIAQRVIDSGAVRPNPGSKRKAVSWPYAALGVVQMNKQEFPLAVQSYQSALRIQSSDYHSWVGLGESYLSSGRYNAASRTLEHARTMPTGKGQEPDLWFADYMYANVQRELGQYEEAIQGYSDIFKSRPGDFGVPIALLQTFVEYASVAISKGFFQNAAHYAKEAIQLSFHLGDESTRTMNFWKAIGDACFIFASLPKLAQEMPVGELSGLIAKASQQHGGDWQDLVDLDGIDAGEAESQDDEAVSSETVLFRVLSCGILAQKLAIMQAARDVHARAVAWYNLGWSEYQVSRFSDSDTFGSNLRQTFSASATAAVKCFKRAIELEAGNADLWNALGVVTTTLNPKIAQHAFVRSLYLNGRSARTWTDLGALYLTLDDFELAHEAFSKAQSTDPDYVNAWVGEGLVALQLGDAHEARSHFEHAFEIADCSEVAAKKYYLSASFEHILIDSRIKSLAGLVAPIFACHQMQTQGMDILPFRHLLALLLERAGDYDAATSHLISLSEQIEALYETAESPEVLGKFIRLKADLARVQLSARDYEGASENAGTALDLSEDANEQSLAKEIRAKTRLSAHLTAGMAAYFLGSMDEAISKFRTSLEESNSDTDVQCLLAQVLWAKGGDNEKGVSKEQLFNVMEQNDGHIEASLILGAMTAVEGDTETLTAVMADLPSLRASAKPSNLQARQMARLQLLSAELSGSADNAVYEAQRVIMADPAQSLGWGSLSDLQGDASAAETKLLVASGGSHSNASEIAQALADVRRPAEAQRAIQLCPWGAGGWEVMQSAMTVAA